MARRKTTIKNKYIHWCEYTRKRTGIVHQGYQVRIRNVPNKGNLQAWFGVHQYGNKKAAFDAAKAWRNAQLSAHKIAGFLQQRKWSKERKNTARNLHIPETKYIYFVESIKPNSGGFQVKVYDKNNEQFVRGFFGVKKYDGQDKAFTAAVKYRDRVVKMLKIDIKQQAKTRANNVSGIIGVARLHVNNRDAWVSNYRENRIAKRIYFYIDAIGEKEAFLKACELRLNKTGKLTINKNIKMPVSMRKLKDYLKNNPYSLCISVIDK